MVTYAVIIDGVEVWSTTKETFEGIYVFPSEYLERPVAGAVYLMVNGEAHAVQRPVADEI